MDDLEWQKLYAAARKLIGTSDTQFDYSIRHNVVLEALRKVEAYKDRGVKALPLACHRIGTSPYVRWHSAENVRFFCILRTYVSPVAQVFGPDFFVDKPAKNSGRGIFRLIYNTRCTRLFKSPEAKSNTIKFAYVGTTALGS
jgi:hypothetical protein